MNSIIDKIIYIFFYFFPILMLTVGRSSLRPHFEIFPVPLRAVDLLTPYLLISATIQANLAGIEPVHLYFYIFLSLFGIGYATFLAFVKRNLLVGNFFRAWWRYVFIFSFAFHMVIGGYGIYINIF